MTAWEYHAKWWVGLASTDVDTVNKASWWISDAVRNRRRRAGQIAPILLYPGRTRDCTCAVQDERSADRFHALLHKEEPDGGLHQGRIESRDRSMVMVGSRWVRLGKANARPMLGSSKATRIKYRSTFRVVAGDEIMQMVWKLGRSRRALHVPGRSQAAVAKASVWAAGTGSGTCGLVYKYPGDIQYCVRPRQ